MNNGSEGQAATDYLDEVADDEDEDDVQPMQELITKLSKGE